MVLVRGLMQLASAPGGARVSVVVARLSARMRLIVEACAMGVQLVDLGRRLQQSADAILRCAMDTSPVSSLPSRTNYPSDAACSSSAGTGSNRPDLAQGRPFV